MSMVAAVIELYFCCGMIFGWVNLLKVFNGEGFFSDGCPSSEQSIDVEVDLTIQSLNTTVTEENCKRDESLTSVFVTASTIFSVTALFTGIIYDRFGTAITRYIGNVLFVCGVVLLAIARPQETDR